MKKYINKNILVVTGGAGFVGSHLIELLLKKQPLKYFQLTIIIVAQKIILKIKELNMSNLTYSKY